MWIIFKSPTPVRGKKYQQIVNLENGNKYFIDIEKNQHEVETDLHVWGSWATHGIQKMFTGSESECVNFINRIAKRLNVANLPNTEAPKTKQGML